METPVVVRPKNIAAMFARARGHQGYDGSGRISTRLPTQMMSDGATCQMPSSSATRTCLPGSTTLGGLRSLQSSTMTRKG